MENLTRILLSSSGLPVIRQLQSVTLNPMNSSVEFHDSKLLGVDQLSDDLGVVTLNAIVHRSEGEPGFSPSDSGVQRVRLEIAAMRVDGDVGPLPAYIYEGSLSIEDAIHDNVIAFPMRTNGRTKLTVVLSDDARTVCVSGTGIAISAEGEFRFIERFVP